MLYRLFPWSPSAPPGDPGSPLYNPRRRQGSGRHDGPALYGALYVARSELSPVAEWLAAFRGQALTSADFSRTDGRTWALASFDDAQLPALPDLDEPAELARRRLRPSGVATHRRPVTQRLAAEIHAEGVAGFAWWSTLEAAWSNVTLFAERALPLITLAAPPRRLAIEDPLVARAAAAVGVRLEPGSRSRASLRRSSA